MTEEKIILFFDLFCPYSYLAWEIFQRTLGSREIPFQLTDIGLDPPGNPSILGRSLWSDVRWNALQKRGKDVGIIISKPTFTEITPNVRRGLLYYSGTSLKEYVSGVFKGVFQSGIDFSSRKVAVDYLQSEGIDPNPFQEALADPTTLEKVEEQSLLWGHERIRTIPTFQFRDERYGGVIDQRGVENFLGLIVT